MSDTVRVVVPITYDAVVVTKGARLPRSLPFKASVPIDIPAASSSDVRVGVFGMFGPGIGPVNYQTVGDGLFLPVTRFMPNGTSLLRSKEALATLSGGRDFDVGGGGPHLLDNPFLRISRHPDAGSAPSIEDMAIRSVESSDLVGATAAAQRIALDFLVVDDGRFMMRSRGPSWQLHYGQKPYTARPHFDQEVIPDGVNFGPLRLEEARDFVGGKDRDTQAEGHLDVREPEALRDTDAWTTAVQLYRGNVLNWAFALIEEMPELSERIIRGTALLWGLKREDVTSDKDRSWLIPVGNVPPDPVRLAESVDDLVAFLSELPEFAARMPAAQRKGRLTYMPGKNVALFRKWEEFERDRIVFDAPPELGPVP